MGRMPVRTASLIALVACTVAAPGALGAYSASISAVTPAERRAMTPSVWRTGCPVGPNDLRVVRVTFHDFTGADRTGRIVVHEDVAAAVARIFRGLYRDGVPIRRMEPIEAYRGSDFASIEADNTSAFNCRKATGSGRWSNHAYGRAIDLNPIENPWVEPGGVVYHRASRPFVKRSPRPGVAVAGGALVRAFDREGWDWGGRWSGTKDYQHFSAGGG